MQRERPNIPEYKVVVDDVSGGEIANIVKGSIEVKGERIPFKGIAYGRYGGQNFAPKLAPASKKRIKEVFGDLGKFEEDLQQKLVRGEFEIDQAAAEASRKKGDHEHHSHA